MQAIDADEPTGLGGLMRWLALAWRGSSSASIEVCVERLARRPDRARPPADLFVGIAILDHFSLTEATDDPYGLVARALEVASRSEMALTRITCLLGVAWGVADRADRSLRARPSAPSTTSPTSRPSPGSPCPAARRGCSPGSIPVVAAQGLLEQLDRAAPAARSST